MTRDATLRRDDLQWAAAITAAEKISAEADVADVGGPETVAVFDHTRGGAHTDLSRVIAAA